MSLFAKHNCLEKYPKKAMLVTTNVNQDPTSTPVFVLERGVDVQCWQTDRRVRSLSPLQNYLTGRNQNDSSVFVGFDARFFSRTELNWLTKRVFACMSQRVYPDIKATASFWDISRPNLFLTRVCWGPGRK